MSRRVMVVDEDPKFRNIIASTIADRGFEVFPAADSIDALRQIYQVNPDVIVFDADVRDLCGFRFLPFVRRRFPNIGVIALCAQSSRTADLQDVVADEILQRTPFNGGDFVRLLEEFSERRFGRANTA